MILYIDTTGNQDIIIELWPLRINKNFRGAKNRAANLSEQPFARLQFKAARRQGERLLPALDKLLKNKNLNIKDIKKIMVANRGGSFTSLRIGVITANALAYALNIPVIAADPDIKTKHRGVFDDNKLSKNTFLSIVEPIYDRPPQLGGVQAPLNEPVH